MTTLIRKFISISMIILPPLFAAADAITGLFIKGYFAKSQKNYWDTVKEL